MLKINNETDSSSIAPVATNIFRQFARTGAVHMNNEKDLKMKVGMRIGKLRRKVLHYTQEEFSERLNINVKKLSNIERGSQLPSSDLLQKIAKETGKTMEYIMSGEDISSSDNKKSIDDIASSIINLVLELKNILNI